MMPRTSYQQKSCDLDGKVGGLPAGGVMGRLVRESAVECLGWGSGGDWCALPNGSHRGKARYAALERFCALCLSDLMEGKRGRMPWK